MLGSRRAAVAWACGLLVAGAAPCLADSWGRLEAPAAGDVVHAGDVVEVRWESLPAGLDEFEVLLSLDGGDGFPIRLTAQLDPGHRAFHWLVPNLAAPRARLRLRVGIDGDEVEGPPGPVFAIVASSRAPMSGLELRAGEWWVTAEPLAEPWTPVAPLRVASHSPEGHHVLLACSVSKQSARALNASWTTFAAAGSLEETLTARRRGGRPCPEAHLRP